MSKAGDILNESFEGSEPDPEREAKIAKLVEAEVDYFREGNSQERVEMILDLPEGSFEDWLVGMIKAKYDRRTDEEINSQYEDMDFDTDEDDDGYDFHGDDVPPGTDSRP